jgi:teichoic acid transport system ATP-binding protein
MSSDVAISIRNLSKCFHMYNRNRDRLKQILSFGKKKYYRDFWALRDVSFDIKRGQTVGIIGRNGSGKSTILQIIAGTLTQTQGEVQVKGRIAALLELGSGFNPEFTGRENVIMSGAILGFSAKEMEQKLPLIEAFAEIGEFIDQPVKVYSSGMYVRLAFACAINVDPDILVIDEALAVGDAQFQLKCIEKLKSFKREGKTILFVSHDIYQVRNFCDEAIWMMNGKVHLRGEVFAVTEPYQDFMKYDAVQDDHAVMEQKDTSKGIVSVNRAYCVDEQGKEKSDFVFGEPINVIVDYTLHSPIEGLVGGVILFDKQNTYVCGLNTKLDNKALPSKPGRYKLELKYNDVNLLPNTYYVSVGFLEDSAVVSLEFKSRANLFRVVSGNYVAEGLILMKHEWVSNA